MESRTLRTKMIFLPMCVFLQLTGFCIPSPLPCGWFAFARFCACVLLTLLLISSSLIAYIESITGSLAAMISKNIEFSIALLAVMGACALFVSTFFTFSVSRHLPRLIRSFAEYRQRFKRTKDTKVLAAVSGAFSVVSFAVLLLVSLFVIDTSSTCTWSSFSEHDDPWWELFRCVVFQLYLFSLFTRLWVPVLLYAFLWFLLLLEGKRFNAELRHQRFENMASPALHLEHFRLRHSKLCTLIDKSTVVLRHFLFVTYAGGMPVMLLGLHIFIYADISGQFLNGIIMYMIVHACAQLAAVTMTGAVLSLEMHKPSGILSSLRIEQMAGKPYNAISAFQSQLQSGPIGFHVYRLFVIDTSTILMICGTVLTYAVITIQFKPTEDDVITNVTSANMSLH